MPVRVASAVTAAAVAGVATVSRIRYRRAVAIIDAHVRAHPEHWVERPAVDGEFRYVALGDSAAQGVGSHDPSEGYVGRIATRLEGRLGRGVHIANLSVSGAHIADVVRDQLPQLAQRHADLVTVAVGGNDVIARGFDRAELAAAIDALCAGLPQHAVVSEVPFFGEAFTQRRVRYLNKEIHAAAERHGLVVAPLHRHTKSRWPIRVLGDLSVDFFHPGPRGYQVWATALWEGIEAVGVVPSRSRG